MKQLLITIAALVLVGCGHKSIGGYVSASSFSKKGFAKSHKQAQELRGKILKVWGYVDGLNVFPADSMDNQTGKWRFFLKAKPSDHTGQSIPILVPVDDGHDKLVALFKANALSHKPTRVFVTGKISTFDAPMNFVRKTGLVLEVNSSKDILLNTTK